MKLLALFLICMGASAQTTVYLRASGPQAVQINGASNTTPVVVQTTTPHGYVGGETIINAGACSGIATTPESGRSPINGIRKVKAAIDSTHFSITDISNADIVANGPWVSCGAYVSSVNTSQWTGKVTPFVLGTQPLGWLDGPNGPLMRKLSLGTANGLTSLVVTSNVATAITSYNHLLTTGDKISVWGSGNTALNTGNGTGAGFGYTVTVVDATHFTFPVPGVPNGTYSNSNNACGPSATPNDLRGGTQDCLRLSQLAYTGNQQWVNNLAAGNTTTAYAVNQGPNNYKSIYDGGGNSVGSQTFLGSAYLAQTAIQFIVDPSNDAALAVTVYGLKFAPHMMGVNWSCFKDGQSCAEKNMQDTASWLFEGFSWLYAAGSPYITPTEKQRFLDQMYNDKDDVNVAPSSDADMDLSLYNHNKILVADVAQGGSATTITLSASDTQPDNYYVGNIINIFSLPGNLLLANYTSGITATGASGTFCLLGGFNGGGSSSDHARVYLTGTNTIAGGTPIAIYPGGIGGSYTSYPTSATATSGTATCSGTATITSVTGPTFTIGVGRVTSYVASTKVATIATTWTNGTPGAGTAYKILASMTLSNATPLTAGVTATGIHTTWNTPGAPDHVNVGDAIAGANAESDLQGNIGGNFSIVTAVNSDTSLTVINNSTTTASTTIPTMAWIAPQWQTGDVGLLSVAKYWVGEAGPEMSLYPILGGADNSFFFQPSEGGNNNIGTSFGRMVLEFATATDDPRAIRELAISQSYGFDYELRHYMDYIAGSTHSGSTYGPAVAYVIGVWARILQESVPTFPSMDLQGNWVNQMPLFKMFSNMPDLLSTTSTLIPWPVGYGALSGDSSIGPGAPSVLYYMADANFLQNPTTNATKYYRNWLETNAWDIWHSTRALPDNQETLTLLQDDPRQASLNFTVQPLQYDFHGSSAATCATLTGWPCFTYRGDLMISRTSWTDRTATHVFSEFRTFAGDHDIPSNGNTTVSKVGSLLSLDSLPQSMPQGFDHTIYGNMLSFGTPSINNVKQWPRNSPVQLDPGTSPIIRWASANHGTWDPNYGDQTSKYAYATGDLSRVYLNPINYAQRTTVHLKDFAINSGTGEDIVVQYDSADVTGNPTNIQTHVQYAQNGEPASIQGGTQFTYNEGQTTCPGTGTCSALNTNRFIQSIEDGGTDSFNPQRNYGVLTRFFSPGTVTVQDDTPDIPISVVSKANPIQFTSSVAHGLTTGRNIMISGATGDWAALNTGFSGGNPTMNTVIVLDPNNFTIVGDSHLFAGTFNGQVNAQWVGAAGWTHRVSVCGGSSCGASVNTFDSLVVHKVMKNLSDTTLTATALNPDANWTGVQTADKVVLLARGGVLHSTMTGFTSTHAGTAQYLFGGLAPGSYAITVGGTAVTGSPFAVTSANDASIHFESTAGAVALSGTVTTCTITNSSLAGGQVGISYSQTLATTGCTGSITWGTVSGVMCLGLALNTATGAITGIPTTNQTCNMVFSATDSAASPITVNANLPITITTGPPVCTITTASLPNGTANVFYSQTIATTGCTPNPPTSLWALASGTMCTGLTLNSGNGTISGTSLINQTCTFVVQVTDTVPNTALSPTLSITFSGAVAAGGSVFGGKGQVGGAVIIH